MNTVRHRSREELQTFTERYRYAKALGVDHIIKPNCEMGELQIQYLWLEHSYDELMDYVMELNHKLEVYRKTQFLDPCKHCRFNDDYRE